MMMSSYQVCFLIFLFVLTQIWVILLGYKDEKAGDYTALQVKIILTGAQLFKAHLIYSWIDGKCNYLPLKEDFHEIKV